MRRAPGGRLLPYTTLFRSSLSAALDGGEVLLQWSLPADSGVTHVRVLRRTDAGVYGAADPLAEVVFDGERVSRAVDRSEEHTSELQSHSDRVCRLLLQKNK